MSPVPRRFWGQPTHLEMTGSYSRAYQRSWTSLRVKRQLNFTPRWTDVRSLVCKAPEWFAPALELGGTLPCHLQDTAGLDGGLGTGGCREKANTTPVVGSTTCNTALMSRRSSAGFQRPRSLVTWSGCLLFFTRFVSPGAGAGLGGTGVLGALDTWAEGRSRVSSSGQLGLQA